MFVVNSPQLLVKFTIPQLMNVDVQFVQIMAGIKKPGFYLSPQLIDAIGTQNWTPQFDKYKSDVFSLGMVMLEIAHMKPMDECYDYSNFRINWDKVNLYLESLKQKYGEQIFELI